jgi:hypothetical protein
MSEHTPDSVEKYLKDGETVSERMDRFHAEVLGLMKYLAHEKRKHEAEISRLEQIKATIIVNAMHKDGLACDREEAEAYANGTSPLSFVAALSARFDSSILLARIAELEEASSAAKDAISRFIEKHSVMARFDPYAHDAVVDASRKLDAALTPKEPVK